MTLPTFLVVGAMKAGTTALHDYLGRQPGVFVSEPKELDFFRSDGTWDRGIEWYESQFVRAAGARAIGESSPNYSKRHSDPLVASRIAAVVPRARIVYLVRHPIDRIVSMYRHLAGDGLERRPFADAVLGDPDYVDTSRYAYQLEAFLAHFDRSQVLVVASEDLRDHRAETVLRVLDHIRATGDGEPVGLDREPNRTEERRVPRRWGGGLMGSKPVTRVLDRSWRLRGVVHRLSTRRAAVPHVSVPPEVESELWRRLEPDMRGLGELVPGLGDWPAT